MSVSGLEFRVWGFVLGLRGFVSGLGFFVSGFVVFGVCGASGIRFVFQDWSDVMFLVSGLMSVFSDLGSSEDLSLVSGPLRTVIGSSVCLSWCQVFFFWCRVFFSGIESSFVNRVCWCTTRVCGPASGRAPSCRAPPLSAARRQLNQMKPTRY